jgi:uncharacterized membrane protein
MSLGDSDYKAIAAEIRQQLGSAAVTIPWLEEGYGALFEITGEVLDETDREEIAAEINADQDIAAAVREREVEIRERLTSHEKEIEDLRQKLARKERQEETAWAVWETAFLLLVCATIVTSILCSLFNDALLVELALCLLLMVVVSLVFPEIVVRTSGVTRSSIWQRLFNRPSCRGEA